MPGILLQQSPGVLRRKYVPADCDRRCTAKCLLTADVAGTPSKEG